MRDKNPYIVHFTSPVAFNSIKSCGWIYNQKDRKSRNIFAVFEGSVNRRIGPNDISLEQQGENIYDEGIGVYFRVLPQKPQKQKSIVAIGFRPNILDKYGWFINTEENFGFKLGDDKVISPFSGELGRTIYNIDSPEITERSELVIPTSVSLADAIEIIT